MATIDLTFERGLPANVDAERFVLGSILLNQDTYFQVAGAVEPEDFSLEKHRRIFARMKDLYDRGEKIDRVTLANELMKQGQIESVDGFSYLVSLDEGLPALSNLDSYIRIVKDKATLRKLIFSAQKVIDRCLIGEEEPDEILAGAEESLLKLGEARSGERLESPATVIGKFPGGVNAFLDPSQRVSGLSTGFAKFDEMTGGLHGGELLILAARPSMGKTALALNIAQHVATHPQMRKPVAVFSLEMSSASLLTRLLCSAARVDQHKFRAGYLNADERRKLQVALADLTESPLFLDDTAGVNLMDIHSKLRRMQAEHGLSLVVIDYLQLMSSRGRSRESQPGSERDFARPEVDGQGSGCSVPGALAVEPRVGDSHRRSQAAVERSARFGIDRTGRGSGRVHLPRGSVQARSRRLARPGRSDHRQAAQRSDRQRAAAFPGPVHAVRKSRGRSS